MQGLRVSLYSTLCNSPDQVSYNSQVQILLQWMMVGLR